MERADRGAGRRPAGGGPHPEGHPRDGPRAGGDGGGGGGADQPLPQRQGAGEVHGADADGPEHGREGDPRGHQSGGKPVASMGPDAGGDPLRNEARGSRGRGQDVGGGETETDGMQGQGQGGRGEQAGEGDLEAGAPAGGLRRGTALRRRPGEGEGGVAGRSGSRGKDQDPHERKPGTESQHGGREAR